MQSDIRLCRVWIPKVRTRTASGKDKRECYRDAKKLPKKCWRNTKCFSKATLYAKNQILKNVNMIYHLTNTQRKSWNIYIKKNEGGSFPESGYVTVSKQFKTNQFQNRMFLKPSWATINTEVIIFNIRLSTITKFNREIQEQWHFAPMIVYGSIHPWARS